MYTKCLDISGKVQVLEFAKQNPNLGSRRIADHFGIRKTQIQTILKNKDAIMNAYASNESRKKETFIQVHRHESGSVGLVHNVQKL